jgi:hypothetical protein
MTEYIASLQEAISRAHGCEAEHVATEAVKEVYRGLPLWSGDVEVFDLRGHAAAERCYAWAHVEQGAQDEDYIIVLAIPPINSARAAVQAALLREVKEEKQERQQVAGGHQN